MASAQIGSFFFVMSLIGCQSNPIVAVDLDEHFFRCRVQPVLERSCATLECHGSEQRPLRVFARNRLRLDADPVQLNLPMRDDELQANFDSAASFAGTPASDSFLVRKPLDEDAGGYLHRGRELHRSGDVFGETDNDDYQTLLAWVVGDTENPTCAYAGQEEATE